MTEKKVTEKKTAKTTAAKKTTTRRTTKKTVTAINVNAESVGFRAGDVYQALSVAECPLSIEDIAKAAKITTEEVLLGMGWLLKEGKIKGDENKFLLA